MEWIVKTELKSKRAESQNGEPAMNGETYFTSSFKPKEIDGVPSFATFTRGVCAVNFANQVHCFNLRKEKKSDDDCVLSMLFISLVYELFRDN